MINPTWILELRNDSLTYFFKGFSAFPSDYFYLFVIALGYWLRPKNLLFVSLGCLVPFSALLNGILKNAFRILRPDSQLHLISVPDPFGFPSGDVQVATAFWLFIYFSMKKSIFRYMCFIPIIGTGASRIYLGIHSTYDVLAGFIVGFLLVYIFNRVRLEKDLFLKQNSHAHQWLLIVIIVMIGIYTYLFQGGKWPSMISISTGVLLGFALSLPWIKNIISSPEQTYGIKNYFTVTACLITLIVLAKCIPTVANTDMLLYATYIFKYLLISLFIFSIAPKFIVRKP